MIGNAPRHPPHGVRQVVRNDKCTTRIHGDADIVAARKSAREMSARIGFSRTDLTLIATAVMSSFGGVSPRQPCTAAKTPSTTRAAG